MRYNAVSPDEFQKSVVLAEGEAFFVIKNATDKGKDGGPLVSQAGNEMMRVDLLCTDANGKEGLIFQYLVDSAVWTIHALCCAIGKEELYTSGTLNPESLIGMSGKCTVKDDFYKGEKKSVINKFLKASEKAKARVADQNVVDEAFNDGIPF